MQTVTRREDVNSRDSNPRAIKVILCRDVPFLTFVGERADYQGETMVKYAVVGTAYGWLHNSAGDIRFWNSASGARRAAKAYRPL